MKRSIFDSELITMNTRVQAGLMNAAPISLENLGPQMRAAGVANEANLPKPESNSVTIKLIVKPESVDEIGDWLESTGGEVVSSGASVIIARLGVEHLGDLENVDGILRAEASRKLELRMEDARGAITGADTGITNHSLTGTGVVVGVIDSGVDWSHRDFIDSAGTRIERFIHAHRAPGTNTSTYNFFNSNDINGAINGTNTIPKGDSNGHGTHCAGISVGNGNASGGTHTGIANGATLMAMRSSLFDDEIITGIRDIFSAAGDRPAVINLSLGGHWGAHDGTSAIENVIASETGPGRIIVVAAGNEGSDNIHWNNTLIEGQILTVDAVVQDNEFQFIDVWIPRGDDVTLELEVDNGQIIPIDGMYHSIASGGRVGGVARVDLINNDQNVTLFFDACTIGTEAKLHISAVKVTQGHVHAWGGPREPDIFPAASNDYSIGMPATEEQAISVGSFVSRNRIKSGDPAIPGLIVGELSAFSSLGPTRYDVQKPDISAPGQFITSALAKNSEMANLPRFAPFRDAGGELISIQGTSMATPFVVGVIALMLEREPSLNPAEIKQRMRATATRNTTTGRIWNNQFGQGRIDVAALLDYGN